MRREAKDVRTNKIFKTPLGWAGVAVSERGIERIVLPKKERKAVEQELASSKDHPSWSSPQRGEGGMLSCKGREAIEKLLKASVRLLHEYFSGKSLSFDLPLDPGYYTPFQKAVWKACAAIPFGETRSYGWIAQRIGNPQAARAVGQAMGANPIPILIP